MNDLRVRGKLVRDIYMGSGKSGPYAAGTLEIPDGEKHLQWLEFYAPGPENARVFGGARVGDAFELHGSLSEKKKMDGTRIKQMRVNTVRKPGQASSAQRDEGFITEEDIPEF